MPADSRSQNSHRGMGPSSAGLGVPLEADRLVVAGRRAHVAECQAIFDQRGAAAAGGGVNCDGVLAYGTVERFRVHAIASSDHAVTHVAWLLPDRRGVGSNAQPLLRMTSAGYPVPAIVRVHQLEGDDPPPQPRSERISLEYAACTCA